ncbi:MAG: PHP domain-containing protein [Acidimicrobiia bacterium]|nr:PHP domain-containing protein [Acidimicrobiia bacterium]
MAVDLHTHSSASDGSLSPADLVHRASSAGLSAIALTDHDTQEGVAEAVAVADEADVEVVPGTELSLDFDGGGMHLLVLWLEPGTGPLQDRLGELQEGREGRNQRIVELLAEFGMPLSIEEILEEAGTGSVGRPHIAAVMMRRGYVPSIQAAFEQWLGNDRPAYVGRPRLDPEEAIALARQSAAVPVLAHPHTLGITRSEDMAALLTKLKSAGLIGLEAIYSSYRRHEREGYSHLASRFGLVPSGGSDFHGSYKPGLDLGSGFGDLYVPDEVMHSLRTYAGVT